MEYYPKNNLASLKPNILEKLRWFAIYADYGRGFDDRYDVVEVSKNSAKKYFKEKYSWLKISRIEELDGLPDTNVWLW